jgi:hypothetical protein
VSNVTTGLNFHAGKWDRSWQVKWKRFESWQFNRELRTSCTHPEVPAVAIKPLALLETWPDVVQQWVNKITLRLWGRLPTDCRKWQSHVNSLNPWGTVLHQEATVAQLVKKLPAPYTIQRTEQLGTSLWPAFAQVTSLNLGWVTNYPHWGISWFVFSSSRQMPD